MHKFIDLFCGVGGFHVALQRQGMECVFACDIDEKARKAYYANFGLYPKGDITLIESDSIPAHDVLCAGFPCQPFSLSGKAKAFGDDRGRLFYEIVRIAKRHRPPLLLLENVKNILTIDNGEVRKEIHRSLEAAGYNLEHYALNASLFGVPQKRERVYFVGIRNDCVLKHGEPERSNEKIYLKDILLARGVDDLIIEREDMELSRKNVEPSLQPIQIGYVNKGGQGERIYSPFGHAITQSASSGGVGKRTGLYFVDGKVRRLHIDECKQVMGFDTSHQVSEGLAGYSQLGNAVIPKMVSEVYQAVRA